MNSGLYAACAGLVSRTKALDTIANNLANVSTAGFRARQSVFNSVLVAKGSHRLSVVNQDANDYGVLSGTALDTTQGSLEKTGNELDVALEGPGYLTVKCADGSTAYTRGGNLSVSSIGQLITSAGDPVMGDNGPIQVLGKPVSISTDGSLSAGGAIFGHLKVAEFPAGTDLNNVGSNYYKAPQGVTPTPSTTTQVRQGAVEASNVNSVSGMVQLIEAQREVETMRRVLTMFNSEIDKTASQDLPRIS
jgi:flagellar basal-body rod protein FlgF/flagellar basal-body rod protein FlgG